MNTVSPNEVPSPRIIVIDDDEAMRMFCLKALEEEHYRVVCTGNAIEGLAWLEREPADLLIIDVLLSASDPHMPMSRGGQFESGVKVMQAALNKRPDTPILFISSHSTMMLLSKGVDGNRWPVLRKPFSTTVLRTEVAIRLQAARHQSVAPTRPDRKPRHPIHCRVAFTGDHEGEGVTENISISGCLLNTKVAVELGSYLTLRLMLESTPDAVKISVAVVKRTAPEKVGLEFVLIEEHDATRLATYLSRRRVD